MQNVWALNKQSTSRNTPPRPQLRAFMNSVLNSSGETKLGDFLTC